MSYGGLLQRMIGLAMRRPSLIPMMLGAAWRFRARGWYRYPPFLPIPPAAYVAWRLHTAYGAEDAIPPEGELIRYLGWSSRLRKREGGHGRTAVEPAWLDSDHPTNAEGRN